MKFSNFKNTKLLFTFSLFIFWGSSLFAYIPMPTDTIQTHKNNFFQSLNKPHTFNYGILSQLFPIRDTPMVGYISSYRKDEKILFEVHPVLSLTFYNDFKYNLSEGKLFSQGYSFNFRPQFRMYSEKSTPIKMPSYNITLGIQHLFRLSQNHLICYSLESGHYSNGQSGSSLMGGGEDGSPKSDSLWTTITPHTKLSDVINRKDGNFSTNLSELLVNYRFIPKLDEYNRPKQVHSFTAGVMLYHDRMFGMLHVGGYVDEAIKIYGKWRFSLSYDYNYNFKGGYRFHISESLKIIQGAHPSVNPIRSVLQFTFFLPQSVGLHISHIYGHDDYNLRFVDSGHQLAVGLTWDLFPPMQIAKEGKGSKFKE